MWKRSVPQKTKKNTIPEVRRDVEYFSLLYRPTGYIYAINMYIFYFLTQCEVEIKVSKIISTPLLILDFIIIIIIYDR